MKNLIAIIICSSSIYSACCQSIGLKANTQFSANNETNNAFGGGLYININDFSRKIECVLYCDYLIKKNEFKNCAECPTKEVSSSYQNLSIGISGLWVNTIQSNVKFKMGPALSYNNLVASRQGQIANWIETFKANYIGTGLLTNIQFQQIFKLPLNFEIFIFPAYLINIKNETKPTGIKSEYAGNQKLLNMQLGLSYIIK